MSSDVCRKGPKQGWRAIALAATKWAVKISFPKKKETMDGSDTTVRTEKQAAQGD